MLVWAEVMRFHKRKLSTLYNFCVSPLVGTKHVLFLRLEVDVCEHRL